jgi:hypothetical protein
LRQYGGDRHPKLMGFSKIDLGLAIKRKHHGRNTD